MAVSLFVLLFRGQQLLSGSELIIKCSGMSEIIDKQLLLTISILYQIKVDKNEEIYQLDDFVVIDIIS